MNGFRLGYVPGVMPGKWVRTWRDRLPDDPLDLVLLEPSQAVAELAAGSADAVLARSPFPDKQRWHTITLYQERSVVVVPKDHVFAALDDAETVALADLVGETLLWPEDDCLVRDAAAWGGIAAAAGTVSDSGARVLPERPATTASAVGWVASSAGLLVVPQSLARLHHRKDLVYREVAGFPQSSVGLTWPAEGASELVEEMVGIVRGRTVNSSRGRGGGEGADRREDARRREGGTGRAGRGDVPAARGSGSAGRGGARGGVRGTTGRGTGNGHGKQRPGQSGGHRRKGR